jgi:hypothetical protein
MPWKVELTAQLPEQQDREGERRRGPSNAGVGFVLAALVALLVYAHKGPVITSLPDSLEFGSQLVQSAAPEQLLSLGNQGTTDLHLKNALIAGDDEGDFHLISASCLNEAMPPGQTCRIAVRFEPLAAGLRKAKLILVDDASNSPQSVDLIGSGIARADLTINPSTVSFADQLRGAASDWQTISLRNIGGTPLAVSAIELVDESGSFSVDSVSCLNVSLISGESCDVKVRFTPAEAGTFSAHLIVHDGTNDKAHDIVLSGNGRVASVANAQVAPSPVDFGRQPLEKSALQTVTITSTGTIALQTGEIQISGEGASEFVAENKCAHTELAPGAQCQLQVRFTARAQGSHEAQLLVADNAGNSLQRIALRGYGVAPPPQPTPKPPPDQRGNHSQPLVARILVHPEKLTFDQQEVRTSSAAEPVTITSVGTAAAQVQKFSIEGSSAGDFAAKDVNCGNRTLAPNEQCNLTIAFVPKSSVLGGTAPERSADLVINVANASPARVALYGKTTAASRPSQPAFIVSPAEIDFGSTQTGLQGEAHTVTLSNAGSDPIPIRATMPTTSRGDFKVVGANCQNSSIPPHRSCAISLAFTPQSAGNVQTDLTIASSAPVQVESVRLRGTALPKSTPQANFTVKPAEIAFGRLAIGTQGENRIITLINPGTDAIPIHAAMPGGNRGDFRITAANCQSQTIPAHGRCELAMAFAPQAAGERQSELTIASASQVQPVRLSGTGLPKSGLASLVVRPTEMDFGNLQVGQQTPGRAVTLFNPGTDPMPFRGAFSGRGDFRAVANNCQNSTVPAHGSCTISLAFAPQDAGRRQLELTLTSGSQVLTVHLSGNGVAKSSPPPPQYGWCCVQTFSATTVARVPSYTLIQNTQQECAQRKGRFSTDHRTATATCRAPVGKLNWEQQLHEYYDEAALQ